MTAARVHAAFRNRAQKAHKAALLRADFSNERLAALLGHLPSWLAAPSDTGEAKPQLLSACLLAAPLCFCSHHCFTCPERAESKPGPRYVQELQSYAALQPNGPWQT